MVLPVFCNWVKSDSTLWQNNEVPAANTECVANELESVSLFTTHRTLAFLAGRNKGQLLWLHPRQLNPIVG